MKYQLNPTYRPFYQLPFCCVPATIQWILYRHNLDIIDQEMIGYELGLRLPKKVSYFFSNPDLKYYPNNVTIQWGTQIFTKGYTINDFFKKYNIPFRISKQHYFDNKQDLRRFLINNLKNNNDIILRLNNKLLNKDKKGCGHFSLIIQYDSNNRIITIGDPNPAFYKQMTEDDILYSISDKIDGIQRGLFVIRIKNNVLVTK